MIFILALIVVVAIIVTFILANRVRLRAFIKELPICRQFLHRHSSEELARLYGKSVRDRMSPLFKAAGVEYPASFLAFVAIKNLSRLDVYAASKKQDYRFVTSYPILGASGHLGPKLITGDRQVPEGIYNLTLEPNTPSHIGLRLDYPNKYDMCERAKISAIQVAIS